MVDKTNKTYRHENIRIERAGNGWIVESLFRADRFVCTTDEEVVRRVEKMLSQMEIK